MTWAILSILLTIICIALAIRVYFLRKSLKQIATHLDAIKRKIPVLRP